ncbi:MAG: RNA polymerase sigma factor [Candidatus Fimenecus sp.]
MRITAELVQKAKSGDSGAWTELYNATYPIAFGVAMQLVKNKDIVDDMLQDSYVSAFTKLDTLEDEEKFQHWFNRIVANNCKNYLVKKNPDLFSQKAKVDDEGNIEEFDVVDEREEYQPDNAVMTNEVKALFYEMVDKLPEEQKTCVLMCWVQGLSIAEAAEILGVSENTVKSRLHYAKKKLTGEAEEIKKKGISVFSITGFALIPFIRWLFAEGTGVKANPAVAQKVVTAAKSASPAFSNIAQTAGDAASGAAGAVKTATATAAAETAKSAAKASGKKGLLKSGKRLGLKIGAGVAAAALAITGAVTGTVAAINAQKTVKAEDYLPKTVYCEGYDGYGKLNTEKDLINVEELEKALCGKTIDEYKRYCKRKDKSIADYIEIKPDMKNDGNLSNGDQIELEITIDYDRINGMEGVSKELKGEESYNVTCTVEGLKAVEKIDLFSTISSVGIKAYSTLFISNEYPLMIEFNDNNGVLDFNSCKITRNGDIEYNYVKYTIEFTNENVEKEERSFSILFDSPSGGNYIPGDPVSVRLGIETDEFIEYGIVFAEKEKELNVDTIYSFMKDTNISDESFNILKDKADRKAQADFPGALEYCKAVLTYDEGGSSYLAFIYKSKETNAYYSYEYYNLVMDQNGNVLDVNNATPDLYEEFMYGTAFDSEEDWMRSKRTYSWVDVFKDIEK